MKPSDSSSRIRKIPRAHRQASIGAAEPLDLGVALALCLSTGLVYAQVAAHGFVSYDDPTYVVENVMVRPGITLDGIRWAFTTFHFGNWHPITWVSYMVDASLFGSAPGSIHLVNVALHAVDTTLLYAIWRLLTGARWRPAIVAALFALHPLHVESVAWISERKDVLSTFFGLTSILAYVGYVRLRRSAYYVACVVALAMGLMTKPLLVSWPFVFLLLDYWPLERARADGTLRERFRSLLPLLVEKAPFVALCAVSSILTLAAQREAGALSESLSLGARVANAGIAYVFYLAKTLWPAGLAPIYPHLGEDVSRWGGGLALAMLVAITGLVCGPLRERRHIAFGWLFNLVTLVPMIGIIQVGRQAVADRYSYVPLIGIFVIVAWSIGALAERGAAWRRVCATSTAATLAAFAVSAHAQVGHWRDSLSLFRHTLAVTKDNSIANVHYANALQDQGRIEASVPYYQKALSIEPDSEHALVSLGNALSRSGRLDDAWPLYEAAIRKRPSWTPAYVGQGNARLVAGDLEGALRAFRTALELSPELASAHNGAGIALARLGEISAALSHFEHATRLRPDMQGAVRNLEGARRLIRERTEQAIHEELEPRRPE